MKINTDRISVNLYRERSYHDMSHADSSMYMLWEDMTMGLFSARRSGDSKVILEPDNKETRSLFLSLFFSKRAYRQGLLEAVEETTQRIASQIYEHGTVYYEIVRNEEFPGVYVNEIEMIDFDSCLIKSGYLTQRISGELAAEHGIPTEYKIPLSKVLVFSYPDSLGGPKQLQKIKNKLHRYYENDPMFGYLYSPLQSEKTYSLTDHREAHDKAVWKLTSRINWIHRKQLANDEHFTEFYYLLRLLKFRKAKIILRDHILEIMKGCYESFGNQDNPLHVNFELFPTIADMDTCIQGWEKGDYDISFINSVL